MSIDPKLLVSNFPIIVGSLGLLLGGKSLLVALIGKLSGISIISAIRVGLLLAPGGEFAFVAFGEAVNQVCFFINCHCIWKLLVCYIISSYTVIFIYVYTIYIYIIFIWPLSFLNAFDNLIVVSFQYKNLLLYSILSLKLV